MLWIFLFWGFGLCSFTNIKKIEALTKVGVFCFIRISGYGSQVASKTTGHCSIQWGCAKAGIA
jgi:hypothetical protein